MKQPQEQMKTALQMRMSGANVFKPLEDHRLNFTGLVPVVRIWNTGTPSAIIEWRLRVTISGKTPIDAQFSRINNVDIKGEPPLTLRPEDDLAGKTETVEVGTMPIKGHLLFFIRAPQKEVLHRSTILELTAQDVVGVDTTIRQVVGEPWPS